MEYKMTLDTPENTVNLQWKGRFQAGQSGNPMGRPRGARNKATMLAEQMMAEDVASVVQSVIKAAKSGDMVAAKIILDRIIPARKGQTIQLELPRVITTPDVIEAMTVALEAMAEGDISPDEAAAIMDVLSTKRQAIETLELEQRIINLENQHVK